MSTKKEASERKLLNVIGQQESIAQSILNACKRMSMTATEILDADCTREQHKMILVLHRQFIEVQQNVELAITDLSIHEANTKKEKSQ